MSSERSTGLSWHKSSASSSEGCVEVAFVRRGGVLVRDSKDPYGPVLRFTETEWEAFVMGVQAGEFQR